MWFFLAPQDNLKELAGIEGACTVVGAGDYIEIWNEGTWAKLSQDLLSQFGDVAENLAGSTE